MAITWDVDITPLDVSKREARVTAIRTDDTSGISGPHIIITAILDTPDQKLAAINQIWQMHLDYIARQSLIADFVEPLELQAKTNLEAREVG